MFELSELLKREREAFELFKDAYRARFPSAAAEPPPSPGPNLPAPQLAAEADAEAARVALTSVALDATHFAEVDEGRFAEIEWL